MNFLIWLQYASILGVNSPLQPDSKLSNFPNEGQWYVHHFMTVEKPRLPRYMKVNKLIQNKIFVLEVR